MTHLNFDDSTESALIAIYTIMYVALNSTLTFRVQKERSHCARAAAVLMHVFEARH
jgi:hypothetical protein